MRRWPIPGILLLLLTSAFACQRVDAPPAGQPAPAVDAGEQIAPELASIVDTYRRIIVLTTDEATLPQDDAPLSFMAGKLLFDRNAPRLELLAERLLHDLDTAASVGFRPSPALVEAFLEQLESTARWRDADKLVFRDLLHDLVRHLEALAPKSPLGRALFTRLDEDRKALDEIQALYDGELEEIFSRFQTRGMPVARQAWDDYVAYLRTLFTAREVLDEVRAEITPGTRGAAELEPAPVTSEPARTVNGRGLPPKTLVLTFDDGPHPRHTERILEILDRFEVKSIFFKVGQNLGTFDDDGNVKATRAAEGSRKVLAAGHLVAHHSNSHAFLPKLSVSEIDEELDLTTRLLDEVVDVRPALFRPPYGALSEELKQRVGARDMLIMMWNIDSRDWADPVPRSIANRVIAAAREQDRGVVLFHDIHGRTTEALPLVLETLRDEGFRFVLWDGDEILEAPLGAAKEATTRKLSSGRDLGYIVPVEAAMKSFHSQAISMTAFQDINEAIPAKHVFYLMDACYGGLALTRGGSPTFDPRKYLREVTARPARQVLTAGGADEVVADGGPGGHSIFTWTVLQGLEGLADLNGDRHVTATELATYAGPIVAGQSRQTPAFGNLAGSQGGEFVFALEQEDHFLTGLSGQLDDEAIRLNSQLASYRAEIAAKRVRNRQLAAELKAARAEVTSLDGRPRATPAERSRELLNEGLLLYREKKLDEALPLFVEAFELSPSNALAANNVGFAYFKMERYAEALVWYEKTLALDPQRAVGYLNLGEAHEKLGHGDEAMAAYRRFLDLAPSHAGADAARERLERLERPEE